MKSVVKKMGFALLALIMLGACKEVDTIVPNDSKSSIGYLLVSGMEASILEDTENVATPSTRAEGSDINNFDVVITNANDEVVSTFKYGERPTEPIALEGGVYKIAMSSAAMQGAAWEMPVYAGEREVIITRKQTTEVNNFVCKLANIKVTVGPKGFGSENMSAIRMFKPSAGLQGIKDFIIETVEAAGPNPCPPIVIGVGIGGTFDKAALLAKKAIIRSAEERNANPFDAELEKELLEKVNALGIGPQGFGGKTTALAVSYTHLTLPTILRV